MPTIFEQLGSLSAVKTLANEFYDVMESDPASSEIRELHPANLTTSRLKLYKFLSQWFGGPALFGEKYMNARWLEMRHGRMSLDEIQAQQWLYCMHTALNNLGIEDRLRDEVYSQCRNMVESMRSQRQVRFSGRQDITAS